MEGSLTKWTNVVNGWQHRWFVLDSTAGLFSYYTSKNRALTGERRGCVRLQGALIGIDHEVDTTFTITVDGKTFHFQAIDSMERERWIRALEETIEFHKKARRRKARSSTTSRESKLVEFNKKLSESDHYLQILLRQIDQLRLKSSNTDLEDEDRVKYEDITKKAIDSAESIKHAIVLLQIAKNTALPSPRSHKPRMNNANECQAKSLDPTINTGDQLKIILGLKNLNAGFEITDSFGESSILVENLSGKDLNKTQEIPGVSYSSSEDEDFFDAEDEYSVIEEGDLEIERPDETSFSFSVTNSDSVLESSPIPKAELDNLSDDINYDSLYEEDVVDGEDVDMKKHGSVITHLLSQVRIGMDLTKIVLPTFILERRSLLEMYSDFFAHPDLFVDIADGANPEERMIRTLRWYLSSFHAGRKSSIAKKPYNPIIGETFRCRWKIPPLSHETSSGNDHFPHPPPPWGAEEVSPDDLIFVAEQVSHHPPISAFYAEHPKKRICVNAHIYTKSSFLGMSVAVHNIGHGSVTLLDLDEEYTATFPSGYGRSILTVPWIELGGKVNMECPKTGYSSTIEFKTKPFFSSDLHKIYAEVFAPGSSKPILTVDGEWNGKMMAKYATGRNEVFIDVTKMATHPKLCRDISRQEPYESRRLWRKVTRGLKFGDIDGATAAKYALEKRQREEAAIRKSTGVTWKPNLFFPVGDGWHFQEPLTSRVVKTEHKP